MKNLIEESITGIIDDIVADYDQGRIVDNLDVHSIPSTDAIIEIIDKLLRILYLIHTCTYGCIHSSIEQKSTNHK